jgi:hypothetical protein
MSYSEKTVVTKAGTPNLDPITDAPGAHPIGTGIGAAIGGAAAAAGTAAAVGAVTGSVVGPVGTIVGAAIGAVVGGLAGKGIAEQIDPTMEMTHWRENFNGQPYAKDATFDDYAPAYQYGVDAYQKDSSRTFDEVEGDLGRNWASARGTSSMEWDRAKNASRDAWYRLSDRVERATPGDSDRDGK